MPYIGKSPSAVGVRNRFYFTASGGETSLSGSDDNGKTLVFSDASYVDVMLNGGNLVSGTDYTATPSTNTISGLTALVANDVVEIIAYDVFSVSDTVSAASGGTFQSNVNFDSGIDVTGNVTVTGTVTADGVHSEYNGVSDNMTTSPTASGVQIGSFTNGYSAVEIAGTAGGFIDFSSADGTDFDGRILYAHSDDTMKFYTSGTIEAMRIDSTGNVGIGTSPLAKFHVDNTNSAFYMGYGGNEDIYLQTTNGNVLFTNKGATTEYMRITSAGSVGIGTISPKTRLQSSAGGVLNAPSLGSSSTNAPLYLTNNDTAYGLVVGNNSADGHVWLQAQRTDGTATAYNITLNEAGGNVGIGTSSPTSQLSFGSNIGRDFAVFENPGGANKYGIGMSGDGSGGNPFRTKIYANGSEFVSITSAGNVGIGTSSPSQRLHIQGSAVQFTNTQNSYLQINTTDTHLYTAGSHPLRFGTNSIERLNIHSDGNVTISGAGIPASSGAAGRYFDTYNLGTDATSFAIHRLITNNVAGTGTTSADIYKRKNGEFTIANFETDPAAYINFHVGTQPRMRIDSSGRVTMPYQPGFKVGLGSNVTVSTLSAIVFNITSGNGRYNTGGHYNASNGRFTAPVSGAYHFDVGLLYGPSIPDGTRFDDAAFLYLNGATAAYDERRAEYVNGTTGNSGYYGTWIHTQLYMNSGDYVEVINYNRFSGIHGNDRFTWFAGFLIG